MQSLVLTDADWTGDEIAQSISANGIARTANPGQAHLAIQISLSIQPRFRTFGAFLLHSVIAGDTISTTPAVSEAMRTEKVLSRIESSVIHSLIIRQSNIPEELQSEVCPGIMDLCCLTS